MTEYIDLDTPLEVKVAYDNTYKPYTSTLRELLDVNHIPYTAADVRPVVRGKWKLGGYGQISDATEKWYDQFLSGCFFYCSACKERSSTKTHFCPNCGADMREES